MLFSEDDIAIRRQRNGVKGFGDHMASLPYVFRDAISFDKRSDPKKRTYGSRIDLNRIGPDDSIHVRKVISPSKLLLNNNLDIKLLGIKEIPEKNDEAIEFLEKIIKRNRVFFRNDKNNLIDDDLVYLYLKNKTFINAHLIKSGLVEVDDSKEFEYKEKFLTLQKSN